jgi:hypothetical protein
MEEDRETRTDEDVEGHLLKSQVKSKTKARNDEEGDDVEAHVVKNAVVKGTTKL